MTDPDPSHSFIDLTAATTTSESWSYTHCSRRRRRRIAHTYIENNEPIEIVDSPQVNTFNRQVNADSSNYVEIIDSPRVDHSPVRRRRVTRASKTVKRHEPEINNEQVRERSPLGGNFGVCPICLETFGTQPLVSTKCGHVYCEQCLRQAMRSEKKCPTCRKALRGNTAFHPLFLN